MKTVSLKIKNQIDLSEELRIYNSILRFAFNRFQEKLKEKEVRKEVNERFKNKLGSWLIQCAIKDASALYSKHKDNKVIFGGKNNLHRYLKGLISKNEYKSNKLKPITSQGEMRHEGNRLFNFDFPNERVILKLNRYRHIEIQLPSLRKNLQKEFALLQELIDSKQITVTVSFNNDKISFTYDESKLYLLYKYQNLKDNRVLGLDLNPNYIGLSILEFDKNDDFQTIHKDVFDLSSLTKGNTTYDKNKRHHELIEICHKISNMVNIWKCKKLSIEDLHIKNKDHNLGKAFNRLCNNVWNRDLVVNKLKMLSNVYGFEFVEVNPCYSSFIGNICYGDQQTPDMVAASIEIARRGYKKFSKGWFYPEMKLRNSNEQWKQTLNGVSNWVEFYRKVKNLGLKYRIQLIECIVNAVYSKDYNKFKWKLYCF